MDVEKPRVEIVLVSGEHRPRIRANGKLTLDVHRAEMKRPRRIYFAHGVPLDTPQLSESNHRAASNTRFVRLRHPVQIVEKIGIVGPVGSTDVDIRLATFGLAPGNTVASRD